MGKYWCGRVSWINFTVETTLIQMVEIIGMIKRVMSIVSNSGNKWLFIDYHMLLNVGRPRTSGTNSEREWSNLLGFQTFFEVGDGCDFIIVWCMHILASLWYLYAYEYCNINHPCCNWDRWMM